MDRFGRETAPPKRGIVQENSMTQIRYRTVQVDGLDIFFREAGEPGKPAVLLLHGFPSSSFMFRNLMPLLAKDHHVLAPDYPGFGYSSFPDPLVFEFTFERIAQVIDHFLEKLSIDQFSMFIQDYGAPVGLRLALKRPESICSLIVQNGNAYEEGLSDEWLPLKRFWADPSHEAREELRGWLTEAGVRMQYLAGMSPEQVSRFSPDTWTVDWHLLGRPGNIDMQLDLFRDYQSNVELYPAFQRYFRERRPPTLILWGTRDPFFTVDGAQAYQRDLPEAQLHFFDGGHFLLETHLAPAAELMINHLNGASMPSVIARAS